MSSPTFRPSSGSAVRRAPLGQTEPFRPTSQRPVRVRARSVAADTHFELHRHPWAQLAYVAEGLARVRTVLPASDSAPSRQVTYGIPPTRAVWIAPGVDHAVEVLQTAQFETLYLHPSQTPLGWSGCRVVRVSPLLREAVLALDKDARARPPSAREADTRERLLGDLICDELRQAPTQDIGVPLPLAHSADKRLCSLCAWVMDHPDDRRDLATLAAEHGASARTMVRLFDADLGLSWAQWRKQVSLAHALALLASDAPIAQVAQACGYASPSAFGAMFKAALGQSPQGFKASGRATGADAAPTPP